MLPLTKMCLTNLSTSCQKMASGRVLLTHQTRDLLFVLGSKTNLTSPRLYLLIQSAKTASLHTQTIKECQGKRSLNGIMSIISKIWSQSALEHDLSLRCLVLDVVPDARARTGARSRTPRALVRASPQPRSPAPF
jgi:hypothetical protein